MEADLSTSSLDKSICKDLFTRKKEELEELFMKLLERFKSTSEVYVSSAGYDQFGKHYFLVFRESAYAKSRGVSIEIDYPGKYGSNSMDCKIRWNGSYE
jgi:hypothetical protein